MASRTAESRLLLVVNSTEWLNLCARKSIRVNRRRAISVPSVPSERQIDKLFALAPFTKINSSVDLFVLEINGEWSKSARRHRAGATDIVVLDLADVNSHHPVAQQDFAYYETLGSRCGVRIAGAAFEKLWSGWVDREVIASSLETAATLQSHLGVMPIGKTRRPDKYMWDDVGRLIVGTFRQHRPRPAHVETLLKEIRRIADAVAATRDSEKFYIACAIEWVNVRSRKDPLKNKKTRESLKEALSKTTDRPISEFSDETRSALELISLTYPKVFTDEISPIVVGLLVRLIGDSRSRRLKPETIYSALQLVGKDTASATLITFAVSLTLGVELTNQLIAATCSVDFADLNWDFVN